MQTNSVENLLTLCDLHGYNPRDIAHSSISLIDKRTWVCEQKIHYGK
jgi:hypothetical protein